MGAPNTITGLLYWIKSDTGVFQDLAKTVPCTDGTTVAVWADQGPMHLDFYQSTSVNRPLYNVSQSNSLPAINFSGSNGAVMLHNNMPSITWPIQQFFVIKPIGLPTASYMVFTCGSDGYSQFTWISSSNIPYLYNASVAYVSVGPTFGTWNYCNINWNTSFWLNGVTTNNSLAPGGYYSTTKQTQLGGGTGGTFNFIGQVAEFFAYSKSLADSELESVNSYISSKYGNAIRFSPGIRDQCTFAESAPVFLAFAIDPMSSFNGDTIATHYHMGVTQSLTQGNPLSPCLQLNQYGFWRFRWSLTAGKHTISVNTFQSQSNYIDSTMTPSITVKANGAIGINSDIVISASLSQTWMTLGPVTVNPTGNGVVWVELRNNYIPSLLPTYFDHIVIS